MASKDFEKLFNNSVIEEVHGTSTSNEKMKIKDSSVEEYNNEINELVKIGLKEQVSRLRAKYDDRCLLKTGDVMEILGLKKDVVYALFNSVDFPAKTYGKNKYVSVIDLSIYMIETNKN